MIHSGKQLAIRPGIRKNIAINLRLINALRIRRQYFDGDSDWRVSFLQSDSATFDVVTPDFALTEIDKYHKVITEKSKLGWPEHVQFAHVVFSHVAVIPRYIIGAESIKKANQLIGDTDPKDISYPALAIQSDSILVTRDKPIVESARRKGFRRILTYDEFLRNYA